MYFAKLYIWVTLAFSVGLFGVVSGGPAKSNKHFKVVCYLGSWANYRHGNGKFLIEDIDPFICTHLVYGFAKLDQDNRIAAYDPYLDLKENWGLGAFERFNGLKKINPDLTTLLAIGGWNEGSIKYSAMAKNPELRTIFVESCVQFLLRYGFDGLDMDWEYPANRGGTPIDKRNFALLLKELKEAFKPHDLILSAAVSAGKSTIDSAYDVPALGLYLDLINLMAYDFHGAWDSTTGHNAPLYPKPEDSDDNQMLNVDYAVKYWLKKGAPAEKLVLGMALYGRSFTLQNPRQHGLDAPVMGKGMAGGVTQEPGMLGYNEICDMLRKDPTWTIVFDEHLKAPYAFKDRQWVGYDNRKSIALKVDYILKMNLAGGMVWSIETDDFKGTCEGIRYPLLTTINNGLKGLQPYTKTPTTAHVSTSTLSSTAHNDVIFTSSITNGVFTPTSTESNSRTSSTSRDVTLTPSSPCKNQGYFRNPSNCAQFYLCIPKDLSNISEGFYSYLYNCAPGTVFSQTMQSCAFLNQVPECQD